MDFCVSLAPGCAWSIRRNADMVPYCAMAHSQPLQETTMSAQPENFAHTTWECKCHVVFIPKIRRRSLFGLLHTELGAVFHELARQKDRLIEEGHLRPDHVHMLISIPSKRKGSEVIGFIKGKNAIWIARHCETHQRNFTGQVFWARGGIMSARSAGTRRRSASTSENRKTRTGVTTTSQACLSTERKPCHLGRRHRQVACEQPL